MTAYQAFKDMPNELRLLVICSRTVLDAASASKLDALIKTKPDWQQVLSGARRRGVMPLLHRNLGRYETVPAAVQTELSSYTRRNTVHNLLLSNALLELLGTLIGDKAYLGLGIYTPPKRNAKNPGFWCDSFARARKSIEAVFSSLTHCRNLALQQLNSFWSIRASVYHKLAAHNLILFLFS